GPAAAQILAIKLPAPVIAGVAQSCRLSVCTSRAGKRRARIPCEPRSHLVLGVLPGSTIPQQAPSHGGQTQSSIQFPVGQKARIRGDSGTMKLQLQTAIKVHPQSPLSAFTHRILRFSPVLDLQKASFHMIIIYAHSADSSNLGLSSTWCGWGE